MTEVLATIRDTVNPAAMPIDDTYQGVLAYRDGPSRWIPNDVERFLKAAKKVYPISIMGADAHLAQVIDCEKGDLTVAQAADWVKRRNDLHEDATVYASVDTVWGRSQPGLLEQLGTEPCWLWLAWWTGAPRVPVFKLPPQVRIAAVQYMNVGNDWDVSALISRAWPASPYQTMANW